MTTFKVDHHASPFYGHEYPEYTKFARYGRSPVWVPLLVGVNQVRFFALCNLIEVKSLRNTVAAVDMGMVFTCAEPPPLQGCALPPPMHIFPMPAMYPQAVFAGIAQGIERARGQVVINLAIADSQLAKAA
jgi:hypothetical protein